MAYNFSSLKEKTKAAEEWLKKELSGIRTGRATPTILDAIQVEYFGSRVPVKQVASITVEDARTLRVTPYDSEQLKSIEKAVLQADLGLSISLDDSGARLSFPNLTEDRRKALAKIANEKLEEAKVKIRSARDETWKDIQKQEKDGIIGEDLKFRLKDEMQKIVDDATKVLEDSASKKEKEIQS